MSQFLLEQATFVDNGYFNGKLFVVDRYPGAVLSKQSTDKVYGKVYKIFNKEKIFQVLDNYEGLEEGLYKRVLIDVYLEAKTTKINCWVYLYNQPTSNLKQIHSGNFSKH